MFLFDLTAFLGNGLQTAYISAVSQKIHIIGIGGTGMNGVAQLAAHAGYSVSGSDRACNQPNCIVGRASLYPESLCSSNNQDNTRSRIREARPTTQTNDIFQTLESLGIQIVPQDGSGITEQTDAVVYSTAIEQDNPDIICAKALDIPLLHRAEMLAQLCKGKEVIAVAGTAGKSTVTGLLGWIFQCLEKDPTVYCGAPVLNWKRRGGVPTAFKRGEDTASTLGNIRFGTGPWIIEADESDRSFLKFHPHHAIITNIAEDHFELSELHKLFSQFESQVSGVVIKPDPPRPAATPPDRGSEKEIPPPLESPPLEGWPQAGVGYHLLGKHNIENVNNALTLCKALGLDMEKCKAAIRTFKGIERRLERVGTKVIDDFAHSPVKIAAALEAVSGEFPAFSAYWRPHGYTPLAQGLDGFIEVFSNHWKRRGGVPTALQRGGDTASTKLFILPVYFAGGTVNIKVTSEHLVERLQAAGVPAEFVPDYDVLEKRLLEEGLPVLGMGARDPELPLFAKRLAEKIH